MDKQIQLKRLGKKDVLLFENLNKLFYEVFEMGKYKPVEKAYLQKLLNNTHFIAFVAIYNGEVIGGLTAFELPMYYAQYSEVLIYDMAVQTDFQRKGVGKKLIKSLKEYCKKNGIKEFFVPANEEDKHALAFYKSTGGKAEKVVHFNYNFTK